MPVVARGDGVWIEDVAGRRFLDAMSGGSMAATLGLGRTPTRGRPPGIEPLSQRRLRRSGGRLRLDPRPATVR